MRNSRGYSLTEMMIAIGVSLIVTSLLLSMQSQVAQHAVSTHQKADTLDYEAVLGRHVTNFNLCTCSFRGITLAPNGSNLEAELIQVDEIPVQQPLILPNNTINCASAPSRSFAQVNHGLALSTYQLIVKRIRLLNFKPVGNAPPVNKEYTGQLEIEYEPSNGVAIQPTRVSSHFYLTGNQIQSCGAMPRIVTAGPDGNTINNDRLQMTESVSTCPAGTQIIGGGWKGLPSPPPAPPTSYATLADFQTAGCLFQIPPFLTQYPSYWKRTISAFASAADRSFHVISQCQATVAVSLCYKTNILH